ncbi:MAG: hemerythrin domain-containing protein, partial [Spirochaetes bacterium]|nr:hemerythrin domain-containing protein [Spirochaetota bacterium]
MAFIDWSEDYSVGVEIFDKEHQSLVALINELHQGLKAGFGIKEMTYILDRLVEYTSKHFYHEEKAMHTYSYPDLED